MYFSDFDTIDCEICYPLPKSNGREFFGCVKTYQAGETTPQSIGSKEVSQISHTSSLNNRIEPIASILGRKIMKNAIDIIIKIYKTKVIRVEIHKSFI